MDSAAAMQQQQPMYQPRPGEDTPSIASGTPPPGDQTALLARLRLQVEYYFSPRNLSRDVYLRNMLLSSSGGKAASQAAADGTSPAASPTPTAGGCMVPIGVITNFPKVQTIFASFGTMEPPHVLLSRALEGSIMAVISADGAFIGPASQQLPPPFAGPRRAPPQPALQTHVVQQTSVYGQHALQSHPYQQQQQVQQQRVMMVQSPHMPPQGDGSGSLPAVHPQMAYPTNLSQPQPLHSADSQSSKSTGSSPSLPKEPPVATIVVVSHIPTETDPSEVLAAFTNNSTRPKSAESDGSGTWYLTFTNETDARLAVLVSMDRSIAGFPIRARMKSDAPSSIAASGASASGASLSSMSETQRPVAAMPPQGGAVHTGGGAYNPMSAVAQGNPNYNPAVISNSREMYATPGYPPTPYGMHPLPVAGYAQGPPGHHPHFSQYYSQGHQQMYPYYMSQPHGQPGQPPQPMQPFPPPQPHPMNPRYAGGIPPPPPPPRYQVPVAGGNHMQPMTYPYQSMPQYVNPGDGYGHYHGQVGLQGQHSGGGGGMRQHSGGGGGGGDTNTNPQHHNKKKENHNKKKKNKQQKRDSYTDGGLEKEGALRRMRSEGDRNYRPDIHSNNNNEPGSSNTASSNNNNIHSSNAGEHNPHENRGKMRPRRGDNHADPSRRGHGASSPSFNRHAKRLSSSYTAPSSAVENDKKGRADRKIFSAADFPGLGGGGSGKGEEPNVGMRDAKEQGAANANKKLFGYAEALRKKGGQLDYEDIIEQDVLPVVGQDDVDTHSRSRQTEAMEREIVSEFHDLSFVSNDGGGGGGANHAVQNPQHKEVENHNASSVPQLDILPTEGAKTFTKPMKTELPILPRAPEPSMDEETDDNLSRDAGVKSADDVDNSSNPPLTYSEPLGKHPLPAQSVEQPAPAGRKEVAVAVNGPSAKKEVVGDEPKPAGAWGSKRLFANVIKESDK